MGDADRLGGGRGFQLVRTAERLAVHRNTLLHQLTKIEELSGRGVREPRTVMATYLACLADALEWPTPLQAADALRTAFRRPIAPD